MARESTVRAHASCDNAVMREQVLAVCAIVLAGCPSSEDGPCPSEQLFVSDSVSAKGIVRVADKVAWTEDSPSRIVISDVVTGNGTAATVDVTIFGRGMAAAGNLVYWAGTPSGNSDSALYATDFAGTTTMIAMFPGCTGPLGIGVDTRWYVGFAQCGPEQRPSVRVGEGTTEILAYTIDGLVDVIAGWALGGVGITNLDDGAQRQITVLDPRRIAARGDNLYVSGGDSVYVVPPDGSPAELVVNFLPGALDLLADDTDVYVATSLQHDAELWRA